MWKWIGGIATLAVLLVVGIFGWRWYRKRYPKQLEVPAGAAPIVLRAQSLPPNMNPNTQPASPPAPAAAPPSLEQRIEAGATQLASQAAKQGYEWLSGKLGGLGGLLN